MRYPKQFNKMVTLHLTWDLWNALAYSAGLRGLSRADFIRKSLWDSVTADVADLKLDIYHHTGEAETRD